MKKVEFTLQKILLRELQVRELRYHRTSLEPKVEPSQEELDDMCWDL